MFKFLKEKLNQAAALFSKKVEEDEGVKTEDVPASAPPAEPVLEQDDKKEQLKREEEARAAKRKELERALEERKQEEHKQALAHKEAEHKKHEEKKKEAEHQAKLFEEKKSLEARQAEQKKQDEARLREADRVKEALRQEELVFQEKKRLENERRREEERLLAAKIDAERIADEKKREDEKKNKSFFKKLFGKKEEKPTPKPIIILEKKEFDQVTEDFSVEKEEPEPQKPESKIAAEPELEAQGFFGKIKENLTTIKLSDEKFDELFWELEMGMLENNVAVEVIEKIKADLREELTTGKISRKSVDQIVHDTLKKSIEELFEGNVPRLVDLIRAKDDKPFVIAFIGVNGSGKTTTMAKVAHFLLKNKLTVVFAAADTFRAAAIQQLQEHADKLGVKMIKHDYESDPAAVAFDAVKHAKAKGIDVVLIDTAGRLHTNDNLMNELKKLIRVNKPDFKIFIGEAITGNDCVEQAKLFDEAVGIDGIILAKADVDEKGGAALSVSYVTGKPILFMGTGQTYDDLVEFNPQLVLKNIGL